MSELKAIQDICKKHIDNHCEGCPFDVSWNNFGLECDSGVYAKVDWEIEKIQEIIKGDE